MLRAFAVKSGFNGQHGTMQQKRNASNDCKGVKRLGCIQVQGVAYCKEDQAHEWDC